MFRMKITMLRYRNRLQLMIQLKERSQVHQLGIRPLFKLMTTLLTLKIPIFPNSKGK